MSDLFLIYSGYLSLYQSNLSYLPIPAIAAANIAAGSYWSSIWILFNKYKKLVGLGWENQCKTSRTSVCPRSFYYPYCFLFSLSCLNTSALYSAKELKLSYNSFQDSLFTSCLLNAKKTLNNLEAVGFCSIFNLIVNDFESIEFDSRIPDKSIKGLTSLIPNFFSIN